MIRPTIMVVFDGVRDEISVVTPVRPQSGVSARAAFEAAELRLEAIVGVLEGPLAHAPPRVDPALVADAARSNTTEAEFHAMVVRAKEYIVAGDIFQVVLSQRFTSRFDLPAFSPLQGALRRVNPSPYLCYLSISQRLPDRRLEPGDPGQGQRRQGDDPPDRRHQRWRGKDASREDQRLAEELLAGSEAERAEHLMLLDLGRNDVGRRRQDRLGQGHSTASSSSATATSGAAYRPRMSKAKSPPARTISRALAAGGFPAGYYLGAPKVRAMEIIDELEKDKRGIYAGCIGYFGASGDMDTCIVLRASVVKDGEMHVQAGAGIVYDSDPGYEERECVNKAKALFRAAEEAVRFATSARRGQ